MIPYKTIPLVNCVSDVALSTVWQFIEDARGFVNLEWTLDFRDFARVHLPGLYSEAVSLRHLVRVKKAVIVHCEFLTNLDLEVQKFLYLALCATIGRPTETDKIDRRVVWEVQAKDGVSQKTGMTISENHYFGKLHTDSSYRGHGREPEKYVALLCVKPAQDGGGGTLLVDAREFVRDLASTPEGAAAVNFLRQNPFPFATPIVFSANRDSNLQNIVYSKILGDSYFMRYRHDSIVTGILQDSPPEADAMTHWLGVFDRHLSNYPTSDYFLSNGDLLLLDNHEVFHGRTAFSDFSRLLLRIRMDQ